MKTNMVVSRQLFNFEVLQRTKDGYFNASYLLQQWNNIPENTDKRISRYLENSKTLDLIEEIKKEESPRAKMHMVDFQVFSITKKRDSKTGKFSGDEVWMHPYLFLDFAMWISASFKLKVIMFVYDQMIHYRREAGDAYKELSAAIASIDLEGLDMKEAMQRMASMLNWTAFNDGNPGARNRYGMEKEMYDLLALEKQIAFLVAHGYVKKFSDIVPVMRDEWRKRWEKIPKCLKSDK